MQAVANERLQVVVWKWADPRKRHIVFDYSAESVNRKLSELRRHLSMPHDLVCITDDPAGLDSAIRVIPLWDEGRDLGRCWCRVRSFAPDMAEIIGHRFAWIDLDSLIVGPMDPLFERTEPAVFYRSNSVAGTPYNGSMLLMTAGALPQVWDSFDATAPDIVAKAGLTGSDQAWFAHVLGPDQPVWTRDDGVMHFMNDCVPELPPHSRVVFFPGVQKPHMPNVQHHAPWVREAFEVSTG
jgi:hypothetical protein